MPLMPIGDQRPNLEQLLQLEKAIRIGLNPEVPRTIPHNWRDLAYLLKTYRADLDKASARHLKALRERISNPIFGPYIDKRQQKAERRDAELPRATPTALFLNSPVGGNEN
jgi:hypothetical protein